MEAASLQKRTTGFWIATDFGLEMSGFLDLYCGILKNGAVFSVGSILSL